MEIIYILVPLVLTIIIEMLFFFSIGYRSKRFFIICLLINFITNATLTLVNGLFYLISLDYHWITTLILEVVIIGVEGLVYYLNDRRAIGFVYALWANALSFAFGLLVYYSIYGRTFLW